jgi:hypothetical protein
MKPADTSERPDTSGKSRTNFLEPIKPRRTGAWIKGAESGATWEYTANPDNWYGEFYQFPPQMDKSLSSAVYEEKI